MTLRNDLGSTPSFFPYRFMVFQEEDTFFFGYSLSSSLDFAFLHQQPVELVPLGTQLVHIPVVTGTGLRHNRFSPAFFMLSQQLNKLKEASYPGIVAQIVFWIIKGGGGKGEKKY